MAPRRTHGSTARLLISAPYPEAALRAIAEAAIVTSGDAVVIASGGLPQRVIHLAVAVRLISPDLGRRLARRARFSESAIETARSLEALRLLIRLSRSQRAQRWWTHRSASLFDRGVAQRLRSISARAVVAMPGAAEATFERAAERASRRVFHAVNAHPQVHNARLRDAYGERARMEMLPPTVVARVARELALATTVLVPSRLVAEQMVSHGIEPAGVVRVPYGVHRPADTLVGADQLERPTGARRPRILFVGQVGYRKGVPYLLDAARGLPLDLQLVGPRVSAEVLDRLPSNAEYLGPRSNDAVARLMAAADAFVLPAVEDACALVIAEAAVRGLPVITTEQNGASELLDDRDLTIVRSADLPSLRAALAQVVCLRDEDRAARRDRLARSGGILTWADYGVEVLRRCNLVGDTSAVDR